MHVGNLPGIVTVATSLSPVKQQLGRKHTHETELASRSRGHDHRSAAGSSNVGSRAQGIGPPGAASVDLLRRRRSCSTATVPDWFCAGSTRLRFNRPRSTFCGPAWPRPRAPRSLVVLINFSYTHHAPPGGRTVCGSFGERDPEPDAATLAYIESLHQSVVDVCTVASRRLEPAWVRWGLGVADRAYNRRKRDSDGECAHSTGTPAACLTGRCRPCRWCVPTTPRSRPSSPMGRIRSQPG